jgi:hypothetical protein
VNYSWTDTADTSKNRNRFAGRSASDGSPVGRRPEFRQPRRAHLDGEVIVCEPAKGGSQDDDVQWLAQPLLAACLVLTGACVKDTDTTQPAFCDTDCDLDDNHVVACACDLDEDGDACDPLDPAEQSSCVVGCRPETEDHALWCNNECLAANGGVPGFDSRHTVVSCLANPDSGSCGSWAPENEITLTSGVRYVDAAWLDGLIDAPSPLWTCDDAYLLERSGGFSISGANAGEFLYELGLRNGDRLLSVNGYGLTSWANILLAAGMEYFAGETSYSLVVRRSNSNITLRYVLN